MLKKEVLVSGISNLSDARYCAGMFVDFLCFELNSDHKDYIAIDQIVEIKNWVSGPKIGGRINHWPAELSEDQWTKLNLDFLVLDNEDLVNRASEKVSELFVSISDSNIRKVDIATVDHILISNRTISKYEIKHPSIFINDKVDLEELYSIISNESIQGITLRGSHEIRPGESNYDDLMDVLEALGEDF